MHPGRRVALPAVILLLAAVESSAQFWNDLAKVKPQQLVSSISKKTPKELASEVMSSDQTQKIADAIQETTPAKAASSIQGDAKAADAIATAKKAAEVGEGVVSGALGSVNGSQASADPAAAKKAGPATAAPASTKTTKVADALQTMGDAIQHAGETLNATKKAGLTGLTGIGGLVNKTGKAVDALKDFPKRLPDAFKGETLHKAHEGLKAAKDVITSSSEAKELKEAGQGLADALEVSVPAPGKVHEEVEKSSPQAADWLQKAFSRVSHADPEKVMQAIGRHGSKVAEAAFGWGGGKAGRDDDGEPADDDDEGSSNWRLLLLGVGAAGAAVAGGWALLTSHKRGARSPNLPLGAEMSTWSTGLRTGPPQEEPLFTQF